MLPVSLIIPTYNEADNIVPVLSTARDASQVIVVDGGSTDGTVDRIKEAGYEIEIIVDHTPGKGHALRRGFAVATQPYVVIADADGSMDLREIHNMVNLLSQGYDMVKGSRALGQSHDFTAIRALGNWGLTRVFNVLYGTKHTDLCYGFIAMQREALRLLEPASDGFEIEAELIARAAKRGLDVAEYASVEWPRLSGESNLSPMRDGYRVLREIMRNR